MAREFKIGISLVFLTLSGLCPAQEQSVITISVQNYADVPPNILAKAEAEARRNFQQAGIQTVWVNCSLSPEVEKVDAAGCSIVNSTHAVLKIVQVPIHPQFAESSDVLGAALVSENKTINYAYAYYGRIQKLNRFGGMEYAPLAAVFTHEIGHLLLQSRSHSLSGIMSARWDNDEFRQISRGAMRFTPDESKLMRSLVEQRAVTTASAVSPQ